MKVIIEYSENNKKNLYRISIPKIKKEDEIRYIKENELLFTQLFPNRKIIKIYIK